MFNSAVGFALKGTLFTQGLYKKNLMYAAKLSFIPIRAKKCSNHVLWQVFFSVFLQAHKQTWHLELKTFRVFHSKGDFLPTLVHAPVDASMQVLQFGTILTLVFKLFSNT